MAATISPEVSADPKRFPNLETQVGLHQWATPQTRDWKGPQGRAYKQLADDLPAQTEAPSGKLNPRWVETLMGVPVGWVMPSCVTPWSPESMNSDSSETVLIPR